jgi:hypothetical protein
MDVDRQAWRLISLNITRKPLKVTLMEVNIVQKFYTSSTVGIGAC